MTFGALSGLSTPQATCSTSITKTQLAMCHVTAQCRLPSLRHFRVGTARSICCRNNVHAAVVSRRRSVLPVVATYPEPETEKERSPIDIPQEWITPQPSRRPDIFPEFEKLETPLPKPLPGDPELPDEEEEEEEEKKKKNPDEPDKEDEPKPDEPAPSPE